VKSLIAQFRKLGVDVFRIVTSLDRMKALWRHPLYSNALYIMSGNAANAVVGFVFWIVAARLYSTEEVGQASALLSAAALLAMLSGLGLGYGLIRFLGASQNPVTLINSSFTVVAGVSIAAVLIYVLGPGLWSPAIVSIRQNPAYLLIFALTVGVATLSALTDNVFIARRIARFVLARNVVFNLLRLVLPVALAAFLHSFGIFASWGAAVFVSLLFSLFLFLPRVEPRPPGCRRHVPLLSCQLSQRRILVRPDPDSPVHPGDQSAGVREQRLFRRRLGYRKPTLHDTNGCLHVPLC
jgi:hypothetical protein